MTVIWIDPVELAAEATLLGELGARVQETVTGTRTACTCAVPRALEPWLEEELTAIVTEALIATVALFLESIELQLRADSVTAEQSLVAATPDLTGVAGGLVFAGTTMGGFSSFGEAAGPSAATVGGFGSYGTPIDSPLVGGVVGGFGSYGTPIDSPLVGGVVLGGPSSMQSFSETPLGGSMAIVGGMVIDTRSTSPLGGVSFPGLSSDAFAAQNGSWGTGQAGIIRALEPRGLNHVEGRTYVDGSGRIGTMAQLHTDPRTGVSEIV
ncbi:hypothetical protein [Nocardioides terrigena]|uniref:hypothetical protein n=1 Tax=Nocardioides terrigena TaxID=424797 RepID=UPI000D324357|nr:hypothetical protein [Nocardioides terrigena]